MATKKKKTFKQEIPNLLTYSRILVIPVIILLYFSKSEYTFIFMFLLYLYACITDFFDGYLARKYKAESPLGKFLDPIADKLLVATLIILLVANNLIYGLNIIAAILILLREIFVSGLREFMGTKKVTIHVTQLAKWKTTIQMLAISFLLISFWGVLFEALGNTLLWVATFLSIKTGWQYFSACKKHLKK